VASAVEETLRYDAPVQALFRGTTEEVELGGVTIPKGALVMPVFAAANRDPAHYADAEEFRVDRNPTDHLAFGTGIHLCLGAPLARLEARIVGEALLRRLRKLEPAGPGQRTDSLVLRGFTSLPVRAVAA
jgi:cytochrome P450